MDESCLILFFRLWQSLKAFIWSCEVFSTLQHLPNKRNVTSLPICYCFTCSDILYSLKQPIQKFTTETRCLQCGINNHSPRIHSRLQVELIHSFNGRVILSLQKIILYLYKRQIRPTIQCCLYIWAGVAKSSISSLDRIQSYVVF